VNILFITTDQHRADSIGAYGNPVCRTPNIDALAAAGTRFDAARTQHPFCQPARATILTGQYATTHGVVWNGYDLPDGAVDQSVATRFGEAGYRTALIGKAHFASTYPFLPTGKLESVEGSASMPEGWTGPYFGFEHVQLVLFGHSMRFTSLMGQWQWHWGPPPFGLHYGRWLGQDGAAVASERLALMQPEAAGAMWDHTQTWANALPEELHPTTWIADRAIDWLREQPNDDRPFFGWVSFTDPHHPMDPPADWFNQYTAADVAECLPDKRPDEFDTKPPMHRLWSQGLRGGDFEWANPGGASLSDHELATMIAGYYAMVSQLDHNIGRILTTLDELGLADDTLVVFSADHGELLGDHQMIFKGPVHYDGLLRVPLIVRGPGFDAGTVNDEPVGTIDLQPTMLAVAGLAVPDYCQGRPLLDGPREHVLTEDDFDAMIRIPLRTLTTKRYKITRWLDAPDTGELYDLADDPGEFVNRWDDPDYTSVRDDLLDELARHTWTSTKGLPKVGMVG
jgi:arylsulfatase A-like enzyme